MCNTQKLVLGQKTQIRSVEMPYQLIIHLDSDGFASFQNGFSKCSIRKLAWLTIKQSGERERLFLECFLGWNVHISLKRK